MKKGSQSLASFTVREACVTYLRRKAVAEVSKDKEPIGRERAEFNWFQTS